MAGMCILPIITESDKLSAPNNSLFYDPFDEPNGSLVLKTGTCLFYYHLTKPKQPSAPPATRKDDTTQERTEISVGKKTTIVRLGKDIMDLQDEDVCLKIYELLTRARDDKKKLMIKKTDNVQNILNLMCVKAKEADGFIVVHF